MCKVYVTPRVDGGRSRIHFLVYILKIIVLIPEILAIRKSVIIGLYQ